MKKITSLLRIQFYCLLYLFAGLVNSSWSTDSYNANNKQLSIPAVQVGNIIYNNVVVTVDQVLNLTTNSNNSNIDIYTASNRQLFIPSVSVGSAVYNNVLVSIASVISVGNSSEANVVPVTVSGGYQNSAANMLTTSVTLCVPSTNNCQTIDNIQVDTGSTGLRLLSSTLNSIKLNPLTASNGTYHECATFADGVVWGNLAKADIRLGAQVASNASVQLINDNNSAAPIPIACANQGTNEGNLPMLAANGIIGVGLFLQDCGSYCVTQKASMYFICNPGGSCTDSTLSLANQLNNPVSLFAQNNNGVVLQIPNIPNNGAVSATGNLIFGINTQSNNVLDTSALVINVPNTGNSAGNFTVTYKGASLPYSFIDSGSSGLYFNDASIPTCANSSIAVGFYCPGNVNNLSLLSIAPLINSTSAVNLNIGNTDFMFNAASGAYGVFNDLGGPGSSNLPNAFDFGLSFFFGRSVFTGFEVKNPSAFFAYKAYP
jgi:hypothetical protein